MSLAESEISASAGKRKCDGVCIPLPRIRAACGGGVVEGTEAQRIDQLSLLFADLFFFLSARSTNARCMALEPSIALRRIFVRSADGVVRMETRCIAWRATSRGWKEYIPSEEVFHDVPHRRVASSGSRGGRGSDDSTSHVHEIFPILLCKLPVASVNQRFPSRLRVIYSGLLPAGAEI